MRELKYICAQPDELYYAWQVEVMLDNFLSMRIPAKDIHIVVGFQLHIGEWWNKLVQKYPDVGFYFYLDTRESKKYPPSIQPHILEKHWNRFPRLYFNAIFYHDCDILFTRIPEFKRFLSDKIWYLSDTTSYIGYDYLMSKGGDLYSNLCSIMNLDKTIPERNKFNSGGAQHLIKDVQSSYWKRVEHKSEILYSYLSTIDSDIQKWTAGMWALLWSAWYYGYGTKIDSYFNFSMATDTWPKWSKNIIYHNAGVVPTIKDKLFLKSDYRSELPYRDDNPYDSQFCSYQYFEKIIQSGKNSCLKQAPVDMNKLLDDCKYIFICDE